MSPARGCDRRRGWRSSSSSSARGTAEASLLACCSEAMLCGALASHPGSPPSCAVTAPCPAPEGLGWHRDTSRGDLGCPPPCCPAAGSPRGAAVTARGVRVPHKSGGVAQAQVALSCTRGGMTGQIAVAQSYQGVQQGKGTPSPTFSCFLLHPEVCFSLPRSRKDEQKAACLKDARFPLPLVSQSAQRQQVWCCWSFWKSPASASFVWWPRPAPVVQLVAFGKRRAGRQSSSSSVLMCV